MVKKPLFVKPGTAVAPIAYWNGERVPLSQAAVSVFDVGFIQGVTVAEQLRTFGGRMFRLEAHLERLARSLSIIGVELPQEMGELGRIAEGLVEHNRQLIDPGDDLGVTMFVTPGMSAAYSAVAQQTGPTVCVHTQPLSFGQWADKYRTGDSLIVTDIVQVPEKCWPRELKCRSRMHYYLADQQARHISPGSRALMLDENGFVTEASTANVVIHTAADGIVSPPKEHILPGVSVAVLEELARGLGIPFIHRELTVNDVAAADEVLLCSTSPCVWSVTQLNGKAIADGKPGKVGKRLRLAWSELVGLDIEEQANRFALR
jgi:branched-subunit amino acid aminotransferase/4-amino-4-deoxychorismate lyase